MTAQVVATALHVPIILYTLTHFTDKPILAIGVATSISSLIKVVMIISLGCFVKDVRDSYISPYQTFFGNTNNNSRSGAAQ